MADKRTAGGEKILRAQEAAWGARAGQQQLEEIQRMAEQIHRLAEGELDPDDFKKFRLENGTYGIRGTMDEHMIRVKIRRGALTAEQLEALADIAERYADPKVGHITTRQNVQFHHVKRPEVPTVLEMIAGVGLTTREACGNTVRNVTACPYAGVSATEVFNVAPYAEAVSKYFLRHPVCQDLPRKFKIAFEGCPEDHARVPIHDVGAVAAIQEIGGKPVRGFRLYVGGGLGTTPFSAVLVEEFTPADLLIPSIEATLRLFDRYGERKDRNRARIKFLIHKTWGPEEFKKRFQQERKVTILTSPGRADWQIEVPEATPPPRPEIKPTFALPTSAFEQWRLSNVFPQKQRGYVGVHVRCPLGDVTVAQMRGVARVARTYTGGRIQLTIRQNLFLPWVPEEALMAVHQDLVRLGVAHAGADELVDVTRCPGADTCQIAITRSRGLAAAVDAMFNNGARPLLSSETLKHLQIKISGCPNSCGQHHIADLGFSGTAKSLNGRTVPHYRVYVGGGTIEGQATFGTAIGQTPAKRTPEAIQHFLTLYRDERQGQESFRQWAERVGTPRLQKELEPFTTLPPFEQDPKMYEDLGAEGVEFKVELGKGECAS